MWPIDLGSAMTCDGTRVFFKDSKTRTLCGSSFGTSTAGLFGVIFIYECRQSCENGPKTSKYVTYSLIWVESCRIRWSFKAACFICLLWRYFKASWASNVFKVVNSFREETTFLSLGCYSCVIAECYDFPYVVNMFCRWSLKNHDVIYV